MPEILAAYLWLSNSMLLNHLRLYMAILTTICSVFLIRKNIFRKIGVNNVHEATKYAMRAGIVDLAEYYI